MLSMLMLLKVMLNVVNVDVDVAKANVKCF